MNIEVQYSMPLFKKALWAHYKRFLPAVLGAVCIGLLYYLGLLGLTPNSTVLTIMLLLIPVIGMQYLHTLRLQTEVLNKFGNDTTVHFQFSDTIVQINTSISSIKAEWKIFHQLYRTKAVWMIYTNKFNYYIIPTKLLTESDKKYLVSKFTEAGISIK